MAGRGRSLRLLTIPALGLLLLGIAALVRAGGGAPVPPSPGRVYEALGEAVIVLVVAVGLAMLAITIWAFPRPIPGKKYQPRKRSRWTLLIAITIAYVLLGILVMRHGQVAGPAGLGGGLLARPSTPAVTSPQLSAFDWTGFVLGGAVVIAVVAFMAWRLITGRKRVAGPAPAAAIEAGAAAGLVELNSIRDPRLAVIRAYAAMELVFAQRGLERHPHEAPNEYLRRLVAGSSSRARAAAGTLTGLYQVARFSIHPVSADMKEQAISAFESMRAPDA